MGTDEERGKPRLCKLLGCLSCKRGAAWKTQCEAGCCCPSSALVIPTPPAPRAEPASPLRSHSPTHTPSPPRSYQNQGWKTGHGHSLWLSREIKVSRDKCQEEKRPIQAKDNAGKNKHGYKLAKKQFRLDIRIRLKESHDDLWQPSRRSHEDNRIKWILRQGPRWTWKDYSASFVKVYDYDSLPFCISFKFHMPSHTAEAEICMSENYMLKHKGL